MLIIFHPEDFPLYPSSEKASFEANDKKSRDGAPFDAVGLGIKKFSFSSGHYLRMKNFVMFAARRKNEKRKGKFLIPQVFMKSSRRRAKLSLLNNIFDTTAINCLF
jgi:hypothetical protein